MDYIQSLNTKRPLRDRTTVKIAKNGSAVKLNPSVHPFYLSSENTYSMTEAISKPIDKTYKAHREHLQ